MKSGIFYPAVLLVCALSFSVAAQETATGKGFEITVTVKGLEPDSFCYLANYFGDKQYIIDSVRVNAQGAATYSADTLLHPGIYLFVLHDKTYLEMVVDRDQRFKLNTDRSGFINHMKVEGSEDNRIFYEYLVYINAKAAEMKTLQSRFGALESKPQERDEVRKRMMALNDEVIAFKEQFIRDNPDMLMTNVFKATKEVNMPAEKPLDASGAVDSVALFYQYRERFLEHVDLSDNRLIRTPVLYPKIEQYVKKLTPQIPDSINATADFLIEKAQDSPDIYKFIVWWITNQYETSKIMGMDAVFVHMAKNYYTREKAFWADSTTIYKIQERARILDPILLGKPMRSMVLKDTSGVYRSLHDIKAPWTVLLIWDPDCGHCKTTVPKLKTLYDKAKDQGLEVYAVDNEAELQKWKDFINEHDLNWINVADMDFQNNFRYELDIKTTPQLFLLDAEKKIVAKQIDVFALSGMLEDKLGIPLKMEKPEGHDDEEPSEGEENGSH